MKIGILGSGDVAKTLAQGLIAKGDSVKLGSREGTKLSDFVSTHPLLSQGTFAEAAEYGELIILAVKGSKAKSALELAGAANLANKTLIDTTNPIADLPPVKGVLQYYTAANDSQGEQLQAAFPSAKVVKAFNSVGTAFMVNPAFEGGKPSMFIAGNDAQAKAQVSEILTQFGWETEDMGDIEASRAIEPLCQLWCLPGFTRNQWRQAFKFLK